MAGMAGATPMPPRAWPGLRGGKLLEVMLSTGFGLAAYTRGYAYSTATRSEEFADQEIGVPGGGMKKSAWGKRTPYRRKRRARPALPSQ